MDKTILSIIIVFTAICATVLGAAVIYDNERPQSHNVTENATGNENLSTKTNEKTLPSTPTTTIIPETTLSEMPTPTTVAPANTTTPEPTVNATESTPTPTPERNSDGSDSSDSYNNKPQTRTVTDMNGNRVTIPYTVHNVVTLYAPAAAMVMAVDGNADRLAGIDYFASIDDGFKTIDPSIADKPVISGTGVDVNKEAILAVHPDVIIAGSWSASGLNGIGVPVVYLNTNGFEDVDGALTVIGSVLGKTDRAEALVSYLDDHRSSLVDRTSTIPDSDRDNAYIAWKSPLSTFAGGEFHEDWANGAGCRFASTELTGHRQEVNLEQVIQWNPDVILLPNNGNPQAVLNDPEWKSIKAIKYSKVYRMPRFVGDWGSPVPEAILGMEWLANGTYHNVVDIDMVQETQEFYQTFYNYDMSEEQAREIMGAMPAPHIRTVTVTDGAGRTVELRLPIERIVTNYPPVVRMVTTLGKADNFVGVDSITQSQTDQFVLMLHPDIASLTCVGNPRNLNTETALSLEPDLVLVAGWNGELLQQLEDLGLPVFGVVAEDHGQITATIVELGKVLEAEETATDFVSTYNGILVRAEEKTADLTAEERPKVYLGGSMGLLSTATGEMLQSSIIESAGGRNVGEDLVGTRWATVTKEQILSWNPEIILLVPYQSVDTPESVMGDPDLQSIAAVKNHQVYWFPSNICEWDSPSPQTALGLEWLAKTLHPDLFEEIDVVADADSFYEKFYGTSFTALGGEVPTTTFPAIVTPKTTTVPETTVPA